VFIYPLITTGYLSLTNYDLISPPHFVGLQNFVNMLSDEQVWNSLRVTLIFSAVSLGLEMLIGFGTALVLHDIGFGRNVVRTITTIPIMLTPVVIGAIWGMMANYDFGVFSYFTMLVGIGKIGWLTDPTLAMVLLIVSEVWQNTGFVILVLSAGLANLPVEMFEAAAIEGANFWQKLRYLTLPQLGPIFNVVLIFRVYELLRTFDRVLTLTNGGPGRSTTTITLYIYNIAFSGYEMGYSAAVSILLMVLTLVICGYSIWSVRGT
jgi:multiple sugar transport system permease protein